MHVRGPLAKGEIAGEFIRLAKSYLEAAEQLNALMLNYKWTASFNRGQPVLCLTFHAIELFLKGSILKVAPNTSFTNRPDFNPHSLADLVKLLKHHLPDLDFDPPFTVEAADESLVGMAERSEKRLHQFFRYPIDRSGEPWPGVQSFSESSFEIDLMQIREECERLCIQCFGANDDKERRT